MSEAAKRATSRREFLKRTGQIAASSTLMGSWVPQVRAAKKHKILIAQCTHEAASFNPIPTRFEDFSVTIGEALLESNRGGRGTIGGALSVFDQHADIQLVPTFGAGALSGGDLAAADFDRLAGEFLKHLKAAPAVDGVYFSLHGAMAAKNEGDPEGYLLAESRKILGESVPIVVTLDLHGILSDRMLKHSNGFVAYHTYPHVDHFETGERAAKLLLRIISGKIKPVLARVRIPALVRGNELITETGLLGRLIRAAQAVERSEGGLAAGMLIGNPFTDVPDLGSYSYVITDNDPARAKKEAVQLANEFWKYREKMQETLTSIEESVKIAQETKGTVILKDPADATTSGATGDSNVILRQLVKTGYSGRALLPIVDPPAVQAAFQAGVGGTVNTTVGGARDPKRFRPLPITAQVRRLSDGVFRNSDTGGGAYNSGRTAVLQVGSITLVVTTRAVALHNRALFYGHGQDPKTFDLVVVKSPHCEHHMYRVWCARMLVVDAPGATSANLRTLGHTRCRRPIFPLDDEVPFTPQAKIFRRG